MTVLSIGDPAPDFCLLSDEGKPVHLSDYRGKRVVLYFYPKDDTAGCTTQACSFRDAMPEIEEKNAVVLGVSPDGVTSHKKFRTKYNLPFTLLCDEDHAVAELYGVWGQKLMFGVSAPMIHRSQIVIDEEGRIADLHIGIKPNESVPSALAILK